jgi:hypothetical protein
MLVPGKLTNKQRPAPLHRSRRIVSRSSRLPLAVASVKIARSAAAGTRVGAVGLRHARTPNEAWRSVAGAESALGDAILGGLKNSFYVYGHKALVKHQPGFSVCEPDFVIRPAERLQTLIQPFISCLGLEANLLGRQVLLARMYLIDSFTSHANGH